MDPYKFIKNAFAPLVCDPSGWWKLWVQVEDNWEKTTVKVDTDFVVLEGDQHHLHQGKG